MKCCEKTIISPCAYDMNGIVGFDSVRFRCPVVHRNTVHKTESKLKLGVTAVTISCALLVWSIACLQVLLNLSCIFLVVNSFRWCNCMWLLCHICVLERLQCYYEVWSCGLFGTFSSLPLSSSFLLGQSSRLWVDFCFGVLPPRLLGPQERGGSMLFAVCFQNCSKFRLQAGL